MPLWLLAVGVIFLPIAGTSAAALIRSQVPCNQDASTGACFVFASYLSGVTTSFQTFSFGAPSRGSASVTFHGSLLVRRAAGGVARWWTS